MTVSSGAHRAGRMDFDDLMGERRYFRWTQYGRAKLANLMFALELYRRLKPPDRPIISVAAHPGYSTTNLQSAAAPALDRAVMKLTNLIGQSPAMGALPQLYAATMPDVASGEYYGPDGIGEMRGFPRIVAAELAGPRRGRRARLWLSRKN